LLETFISGAFGGRISGGKFSNPIFIKNIANNENYSTITEIA
jgi:hypothetical protein